MRRIKGMSQDGEKGRETKQKVEQGGIQEKSDFTLQMRWGGSRHPVLRDDLPDPASGTRQAPGAQKFKSERGDWLGVPGPKVIMGTPYSVEAGDVGIERAFCSGTG